MKWFGIAKKSSHHQSAIAYIVLSVAIPLLVYVAVQQDQRQSANDPQLQMAQDDWGVLAKGEKTPAQIVGDSHANLAYDIMAPFTTIFDSNHNVIATNAQLDGKTLIPPSGSFDAAKAHGPNAFTWEPLPGFRYAAVLQHYPGNHPGYILTARSLFFVEQRETHTEAFAAATMGALLVIGLIILIVIK
jgi:hypothetical protein